MNIPTPNIPSKTRAGKPAIARGFTLIEIMVVVVIIGLLAAFAVPLFMGRVDEARITKAQADIQALETAIAMYRLDTARYPSSNAGLSALTRRPEDPTLRNWREGGYLARLPRDPWGNEYQYRYPGTRGLAYDLFSLGPDGLSGEGDAAADDIGNWALGE